MPLTREKSLYPSKSKIQGLKLLASCLRSRVKIRALQRTKSTRTNKNSTDLVSILRPSCVVPLPLSPWAISDGVPPYDDSSSPEDVCHVPPSPAAHTRPAFPKERKIHSNLRKKNSNHLDPEITSLAPISQWIISHCPQSTLRQDSLRFLVWCCEEDYSRLKGGDTPSLSTSRSE